MCPSHFLSTRLQVRRFNPLNLTPLDLNPRLQVRQNVFLVIFILFPFWQSPSFYHHLTAIIQSRRLTLFGHIMCMDDNADAKRILLASPLADWRRQLGRPRITWLSTVQQDLKHHHLTLPKAADLAQNHPLWRMTSTYGAKQS